MREFTEQERNAIDDIYRRNFADMTQEDIKLYGEWMQYKGEVKREVEMKDDALIKNLEALGTMYTEQAKAARLIFEQHAKSIELE